MLTHKALVIDVDENGTATVEVARASACASCGDKSSCSMNDGSDVRIRFKNSGHLKTGDLIEIGIEQKSFFKSLAAVYVLPIILMLITAIVVSSVSDNQMVTAASTLGVLVVYFIALKLYHGGKDKQSYKIIG